jgi:hypothetical protein
MSKKTNQDRYIADKVLLTLNFVGIDFDNCIAKKIWPEEGIGEPMPGVHDGLEELKSLGYQLFIFTARPYADIKPIRNWLKDHDLIGFIDGIICGKPLFKLMIDDSAFRFSGDWSRDMEEVKEILHGGASD